jgi:hypothetical protein
VLDLPGFSALGYDYDAVRELVMNSPAQVKVDPPDNRHRTRTQAVLIGIGAAAVLALVIAGDWWLSRGPEAVHLEPPGGGGFAEVDQTRYHPARL